MDEKSLERKIVKYCRDHDYMCMKLSGMNQRGQPDRLILKDGIALFMELKGAGKKPTKLQLRYLAKLQAHGFHACWVDSWDGFKSKIKEVYEKD